MTSDPWFWIIIGLLIVSAVLVVLGKGLPLRRQYKYMLGIGGVTLAAGIVSAVLAIVNYRNLWWLTAAFAAFFGAFSFSWLAEGYSSMKTVRKQNTEKNLSATDNFRSF